MPYKDPKEKVKRNKEKRRLASQRKTLSKDWVKAALRKTARLAVTRDFQMIDNLVWPLPCFASRTLHKHIIPVNPCVGEGGGALNDNPLTQPHHRV